MAVNIISENLNTIALGGLCAFKAKQDSNKGKVYIEWKCNLQNLCSCQWE